MLTKGLLVAAMLSAVLAVLPAASAAQSAGDDQYADPFGPVEDEGDGAPDRSQPPPVQGTTQGEAPESLEQVDELPTGAEAAPAQTGSGETLPRTGFDAWLFAAIGWWTLLGGIVLRRAFAR